MMRSNQPIAYASLVDAPAGAADTEPVLSVIAPTVHGGQLNGSISLATARDLVRELQVSLDAIERSPRPAV